MNIHSSSKVPSYAAMPYKWWLLLLHSSGEGIRLIWRVKWSVYFYLKNFTRGVYLKPLLCSLHHSRRISLRLNITDRVFLWVAVQGSEEPILYHIISELHEYLWSRTIPLKKNDQTLVLELSVHWSQFSPEYSVSEFWMSPYALLPLLHTSCTPSPTTLCAHTPMLALRQF